jgi:hypothetical protein
MNANCKEWPPAAERAKYEAAAAVTLATSITSIIIPRPNRGCHGGGTFLGASVFGGGIGGRPGGKQDQSV